MSVTNLILIIAALTFMYFLFGRSRAYSVAKTNGGLQGLHSLPSHYGSLAALWCVIPALIVIILWKLFEPMIVDSMLASSIPDAVHQQGEKAVSLFRNEINNAVNSDRIDTLTDPVRIDCVVNFIAEQ